MPYTHIFIHSQNNIDFLNLQSSHTKDFISNKVGTLNSIFYWLQKTNFSQGRFQLLRKTLFKAEKLLLLLFALNCQKYLFQLKLDSCGLLSFYLLFCHSQRTYKSKLAKIYLHLAIQHTYRQWFDT